MSFEVPERAYDRAVDCLESGGVIAYPTEAVYGLGCDPFNADACYAILKLKQRDESKGLILIASDWQQIKPLLGKVNFQREQAIQKTWPGPFTWVFPRTHLVPDWISGMYDTVAVRITAHPVASKLCERYGKPIVSTSANRSSSPSALDNLEVYEQFGDTIDYILPGRVGELTNPTEIRDAETDKIIRSGGSD